MSVTVVDHILFIVLALVLPFFAVLRVRPQVNLIPSESRIKIRLYWLNSGVLWVGAIIVMAVWFFTGRSFDIMGWQLIQNEWFPEWVLVIWIFALFYMFDTFLAWNSVEENPAAALLPTTWKEVLHFGSVVSLSAGICEEVVFRGFLITYLMAVLPEGNWNAAAAIGVSSLIFAVLHAYQGGWATVKIALLSVLFGFIFVLTESLIPVILLHFMVDLIGGFVAFYASRREAAIGVQDD